MKGNFINEYDGFLFLWLVFNVEIFLKKIKNIYPYYLSFRR